MINAINNYPFSYFQYGEINHYYFNSINSVDKFFSNTKFSFFPGDNAFLFVKFQIRCLSNFNGVRGFVITEPNGMPVFDFNYTMSSVFGTGNSLQVIESEMLLDYNNVLGSGIFQARPLSPTHTNRCVIDVNLYSWRKKS